MVINVGKRHGVVGNYRLGFNASAGNSATGNWVHGNRHSRDLFMPKRTGLLELLGFNRLLSRAATWRRKATFYDELPGEFPLGARRV